MPAPATVFDPDVERFHRALMIECGLPEKIEYLDLQIGSRPRESLTLTVTIPIPAGAIGRAASSQPRAITAAEGANMNAAEKRILGIDPPYPTGKTAPADSDGAFDHAGFYRDRDPDYARQLVSDQTTVRGTPPDIAQAIDRVPENSQAQPAANSLYMN